MTTEEGDIAMMTPKDIVSKGWTRDATRHYTHVSGHVIDFNSEAKRWVMSLEGRNLFNFSSLTSALEWYEINIR